MKENRLRNEKENDQESYECEPKQYGLDKISICNLYIIRLSFNHLLSKIYILVPDNIEFEKITNPMK